MIFKKIITVRENFLHRRLEPHGREYLSGFFKPTLRNYGRDEILYCFKARRFQEREINYNKKSMHNEGKAKNS